MNSQSYVAVDTRASPDGAPLKDEQSVRQVVAAYQAAWNKHDVEAIAELFCTDIEWVNVVGMWWRGATEVTLAHRRIHATIFKNTGIAVESCSVRFLSADAAIGVVNLNIEGYAAPDGRQHPPEHDRLSLVMLRRGGAWRISHGHNTPVDAAAQAFDPVRK